MLPPEPFDRGEAAAGVESDQHVARFTRVFLLDGYAMAQLAQEAGPALRSDAVSFAGMRGRRCD